jgi:hypothetical protein
MVPNFALNIKKPAFPFSPFHIIQSFLTMFKV